MATADFRSVDEYIASCPKDVQPVLRRIRQTIRAAAPGAAEKISYQMPAFTLDGKILIYYAAWRKHVAVYGITGAWEEYKKELRRTGHRRARCSSRSVSRFRSRCCGRS